MKEIIVIVGPTGVGKTKLSIELAKKLDAEIINGDSVSIYQGLNIGSAKPTMEEKEGIPHHLIDIRNVREEYSVYDYQKDAREKIEDITSRGKRVIMVGGTGLYLKAALYNYEFSFEEEKEEYEDLSNEEILLRIRNYTQEPLPDPNNRRRLTRTLSRLEKGEEIPHGKNDLLYPIRVIGLTTDREFLYERIHKRVDQMVENGLLEEVTSLKEYYPTSRILNSGIGYQEFAEYFQGEKTLEEVVEEIKQHSTRFAKRQYTFFNHQFPTKWYDVNFEDFSKTVEEVYEDIKKEA